MRGVAMRHIQEISRRPALAEGILCWFGETIGMYVWGLITVPFMLAYRAVGCWKSGGDHCV